MKYKQACIYGHSAYKFQSGRRRCLLCQKRTVNTYRAANYEKCLDAGRQRAQAKREFINNFKRKPCTDCLVQYSPWVMQFDHLRDKVRDVSQLTGSPNCVIEREIAKCEVVCSNCHAERTHRRKHHGR